MEKRFKYHNLSSQVVFVEATTPQDSIMDYYVPKSNNRKLNRGNDGKFNRTGMLACFHSHLKAIKMFYESGEKEAIICEDDILLHNDFKQLYTKVMTQISDDEPLVMLSHTTIQGQVTKIGENQHVYRMGISATWGNLLYLIRREYAEKCLDLYDKPFHQIQLPKNEHLVSEIITRQSKGILIKPVLAIEDTALVPANQDSLFNSGSDLRAKKDDCVRIFSAWGVNNYNKCDLDSETRDQE